MGKVNEKKKKREKMAEGRMSMPSQKKRGRRPGHKAGMRRLTNKGKKHIGKFPSAKNRRPVWYESLLERDFIFLLEFDPEVVAYREQPIKLTFCLDDKKRTYTPDFLLERAGGRKQLVEVKPKIKADSPEMKRFFRKVSHEFSKFDYDFAVATDDFIRAEPRLGNLRLLHRYSRTSMGPGHVIELRRFFELRVDHTLGQLGDHFTRAGFPRQISFVALAHGYVKADINIPFGDNTRLSPSPKVFELGTLEDRS
jgi:hypothetical protein